MNPILATAAVLYLFLVAGVCFILDAFRNKNVPKPEPKPIPQQVPPMAHGDFYNPANYPRIVSQAGGVYVGIQAADDARNNLVLFNSPVTGSTLAIKESAFCYINVVKRLELHEATVKSQRGN
jgi:hypothetical protein